MDTVRAVRHIRRMRGGAQAHLMQCSDGNLWVVKFQNNPQNVRVLTNEAIVGHLGIQIGLTMPQIAVVEVSKALIDNTPELELDHGRSQEKCSDGRQFGSRYVGGLMPGHVVDFLPDKNLQRLRNVREFAGILALDKWTGNADARQAVFARKATERVYRAHFIDQGFCFFAGEWRFEDHPLQGVYPRSIVYAHVDGWNSFEPWLSRIESMDEYKIKGATDGIPKEWFSGKTDELHSLTENLRLRQAQVRDLIESFRESDHQPFPRWI